MDRVNKEPDSYLDHLNKRIRQLYEQQQNQRDNPNTKRFDELTVKLNHLQKERDAYIKRKKDNG